MSQWYFVRHGESVANSEGWLAGHIDSPLTLRGREQARRLQESLDDLPVDKAYCSDLKRAFDTAEIALLNSPLTATSLTTLRERHLGDWEGVKIDALRAQNQMATLLKWNGQPPGGESQRQVAHRVLRWMVKQDSQERIILFVHGGIIRAITGLIDGMNLSDIGQRKIKNAFLIEREVSQDRLQELLSLTAAQEQDATNSTP